MVKVKIFFLIMLFPTISCGLSACQPSEPPPDIIKTQREDMQKAKELEQAVKKDVEERDKAMDEVTK